MNAARTGLTGICTFRVIDGHGRVTSERRVRNQVLPAGQAFVAAAMLGHPSDIRFDVLLGSDHQSPNTKAMDDLAKPIASMRVRDPDLVDNQVVLQAHFDPAESAVIGESGIRLHYRSVGAGTTHLQLLYNRALVNPPLALGDGDALAITWTLSFSAITGNVEIDDGR